MLLIHIAMWIIAWAGERGGHHSLEWKKECIASAPGKGIDRDLRGDRGTDLGYEG